MPLIRYPTPPSRANHKDNDVGQARYNEACYLHWIDCLAIEAGLYEDFLRRELTHEEREAIALRYAAFLEEYFAGAPKRASGRQRVAKFTERHPERIRLARCKQNLKKVLASADRYRAAITEFERVKALHQACDPSTAEECYLTCEILAGGAKDEIERLADAERAIVKWTAEIERLDAAIAAQDALTPT